RAVFLIAAVLCAIVPLPFVWAQGHGWVITSQTLSGAAWGSFEVALFVLLLQSTFRATRPHAVAAQSVANGFGQLAGSLLGGAFLSCTHRNFRVLFVVSLVLRTIVAFWLPSWVQKRRGGG